MRWRGWGFGLAASALAVLLGAVASLEPRSARADDPPMPDAPDPAPAPAAPTLPPAEAAKAKALFDEAMSLQEKREFLSARKRFRKLLEEYPGADAALREEADERSAENCLLGIEEIHHGGPSENRVDVELMGDGYLIDKQDVFVKHAAQQMKAFWAEALYEEYESYFNVWRFDLASKENGVDDPGAGPQDPAPPPEPVKKPKPGKKRALHEYSTALNCVAAGPQRQVMADPEMVFKWRKYLKASDGLSLCFANKGELGMGGGGIATTGRMVAVVHEFGHAFIGLLDEYANHGGSPPGRIVAPNAVSGKGPKDPPDLAAVPWKHWLEAGNKEVGLFLGGATYTEGVWRPAATCAMNSGGSSPYCWVCREHGVLTIYEYVSPIDEAAPAQSAVAIPVGGRREFSVVPMAPKSHRLQTDWYLEKVKTKVVTRDDDGEPATEPPSGDAPGGGDAPAAALPHLTPDGFSRGPIRGFLRHSQPWVPGPPRGDPVDASERRAPGGAYRSVVVLEGLPTGRYRLTARVRDEAKVPNYKFPWVIRDPDKLLEERRTWTVSVGDVSPPAPSATPPAGGSPAPPTK